MNETTGKENWNGPEDIVREVKTLRAQLTQIVERIRRVQGGVACWTETCHGARHAALAITHAEDVRLRLGEVLGAIGDGCPGLLRDPYPTSRDPAVATIDPRAPEVVTKPFNSDDVCPRPG